MSLIDRLFARAIRGATPVLLVSAVLISSAVRLHAQPDPARIWHAQWIGLPSRSVGAGPDAKVSNLWTCARKTFTLASRPKTAIARIAVDSRYWLWVNGRQAVFEGGLKRGPTPDDTYYDTVELSRYLQPGTNTIAILAWYWGKDGFSHKSSGKPGLLFEMEAGNAHIYSDRSWRVQIHAAYGHATGPAPNYRLAESPIHFDARYDPGDWMANRYDASGWLSAAELGSPPTAPWNQLWPRPIPQWKNSGLLDYSNAGAMPRESTGEPIAAALPYNAQVTPWLKIDASAGQTILMRTDDPLSEIYTQYVTRDGVQEFESLAWMNGHHVVYTMPPGIKILGLKYRETGYDTEFTGAFGSDREFLNRLWEKSRRTLYVTMRDNFMDCPDRERAQWWGDAVNELGETFYALSPSSIALTRKAISNLAEWQRPDKTVFSPVPAGNWHDELPTQMLASVGKYGFWTYYLYSGDRATLEMAYPHVRDYLSIWKTDDDGLIAHRAGGWDWEDWGDNIDSRLLDNAWYCLALEGAANMAAALGRATEAAEYNARQKSITDAVNGKMWSGTCYRSPGYKGQTDDRGNALAVVAGIAGPDRDHAIESVLAAEYHASPYMEKYVLEALAQMGDINAALGRMEKRYGEIVGSPSTTLPEEWHGGTGNHAWSGGPLTILSQYVAGIAPLTAGFDTYEVRPRIGALRRVRAVMDSVKGKIEVQFAREESGCTLTLTSPAKTSALVCLPADRGAVRIVVNGKPFWETGKSLSKIRGVTFQGIDKGCLQLVVSPGRWTFQTEPPPGFSLRVPATTGHGARVKTLP